MNIETQKIIRCLRTGGAMLLPEFIEEEVMKALWDAGANETDLSQVFVVNRLPGQAPKSGDSRSPGSRTRSPRS
jgi:hypothetical protein